MKSKKVKRSLTFYEEDIQIFLELCSTDNKDQSYMFNELIKTYLVIQNQENHLKEETSKEVKNIKKLLNNLIDQTELLLQLTNNEMILTGTEKFRSMEKAISPVTEAAMEHIQTKKQKQFIEAKYNQKKRGG